MEFENKLREIFTDYYKPDYEAKGWIPAILAAHREELARGIREARIEEIERMQIQASRSAPALDRDAVIEQLKDRIAALEQTEET